MDILSNKYLTVKVDKHGAELTSIISNATGKEYLWQANPAYWKRHSPILFPIVGALWNNQYKHNGKTYPMSQHGFARDKDFMVKESSDTKITYTLISDTETLAAYPFPFELNIEYILSDNKIEVCWTVVNTGETTMHFQIGAHPAFNYPDYDSKTKERGYFSFDKKELEYKLIGKKGCLNITKEHKMELDNGILPIDTQTFDQDALIFEDSQLSKISLLNSKQEAVITLGFKTPLVGLWSPPAKDAPFVCIEPWYGRCDRENYTGYFKDRDWTNHLSSRDMFKGSYTIEVGHLK